MTSIKPYTVFAVYADNHQRYAETVAARNPVDAERFIREQACEDLLVAAVVEGSHDCADAPYMSAAEGDAESLPTIH